MKHDRFPYWPPVILGHEFSGQIVELGPEVQRFAVGDRVVGEPHTQACGTLPLPHRQHPDLPHRKALDPAGALTAPLTSYLKMPERLLHRIPDSMSYDVAAAVEPTANTVHDVIERATVQAGDFVGRSGPGPSACWRHSRPEPPARAHSRRCRRTLGRSYPAQSSRVGLRDCHQPGRDQPSRGRA